MEVHMYRVMIVEDEVLVREAICKHIQWEELGYELIGDCEHGREAQELLGRIQVDVVLTDICMPFMDGMELSEYIYHNHPEIHTIIFSGFDEFEYAKKAIQYKVEEYLLKPVTAYELSEILTKLKKKMDMEREKKIKVDSIRKVYNKNKAYLRSKVLWNLITGTKTEVEIAKDLEEVQIDLGASIYRMAILSFTSKEQGKEEKQQVSLMNFMVYNIAEELLNDSAMGEVFQGEHNRIYMIFKSNQSNQFVENTRNASMVLSRTVEELTNLKIRIGLGGCVTEVWALPKSNVLAQKALEYGYLLEKQQVVDYLTFDRQIQDSIEISRELEELSLATKLNDATRVKVALSSIEARIREAYLEKNKVSLYLQQMIQAISELGKTLANTDNTLEMERDQVMLSIHNADSLEYAIQCVEVYVLHMARKLLNSKNVGQRRYAIMAMDYIEKNYANPDLNLNTVCKYLGVSVSRFSTVFKKVYHETFMEAVIRIRMKNACDLLETTDYRNYEIAEQVGILDPHYFSISFKKVTGKTPSEYAKEKR